MVKKWEHKYNCVISKYAYNKVFYKKTELLNEFFKDFPDPNLGQIHVL